MGTKLARVLVSEASGYLKDETNRRWSQAVLLNWLNYAESAICMIKPDAYSKTASRQLSPGTLQSVASDAIMVGRVNRNMGADGLTPGRIVTLMPLSTMDNDPDWHTDTAETEIKHFIPIPGSNDRFYVWPPVHAETAVYVEETYPAVPTPITVANWTTGTEVINLSDIYVNPILQLMLFRACDMLSSNIAGMNQKATAALALAIQMITGKADAETMTRARAIAEVPGVLQGEEGTV